MCKIAGFQRRAAASFAEPASRSADRASLAVLADLGLSVEQIGRYLRVDPAEIGRLLGR